MDVLSSLSFALARHARLHSCLDSSRYPSPPNPDQVSRRINRDGEGKGEGWEERCEGFVSSLLDAVSF